LRKKYLTLPSNLSWQEENKDDRTGYPFKMFLEEALMQQRNEMM
jgi:hypothetical protein